MKILAMDTSSVNATVCLSDDNKILGEFTIGGEKAHSQIIMPMLEKVLEFSKTDISDIDVFAVGLGPGSFTGLRIGICTMKTLCQALNKKIIGISSLDSIASSFTNKDIYICPILDARRNEVYNALYLNGEKICADRVCDFDDLLCELAFKNVIFAGEGLDKYKEKIMSYNNDNWEIAPINLCTQKAYGLINVALKRAINNDFDDLFDVKPIYLRLSQAEQEYNKMHKINE